MSPLCHHKYSIIRVLFCNLLTTILTIVAIIQLTRLKYYKHDIAVGAESSLTAVAIATLNIGHERQCIWTTVMTQPSI